MALYLPDESEKVTALLGDQLGGMVTGMYAIVQWMTDSGEQRIGVFTAPDQTFITSQGLLTMANAVADGELASYVQDAIDEAEGDE
ncbi:hypothetical protein [Microbacterium sp. gxy059]|uniref:hypothetical protein n=1 Tax=Microbacterium sp. gxy059 TaxID=2957199 RepID=UPI003D974B61